MSPKAPKFVVSAGPTREYLDPVRFFSNPSTGRMGYEIARAARAEGARVVLVSGPTCLKPPKGVATVDVVSAAEMHREVMKASEGAAAVIMAAAVADYRPTLRIKSKIKKARSHLKVALVPTQDILLSLAKKKDRTLLVGFAAETGPPVKEGQRKLEEKHLDLVVANDVSMPDSGFGSNHNTAVLIARDSEPEKLSKMTKRRLAGIVVRRCMKMLKERKKK